MAFPGRGTRAAACVALAALMGGCMAPGPRVQPPDVPPAYAVAGTDLAGPTDATWYAGFGNRELQQLLASGVAGNLDLEAAAGRVRQAAARARGAHGALLPQVALSGIGTRYSGRSGGASAQETDWSAGLAASYELDFWGRNRSLARGAAALAAASQADRNTVLITLEASIASSYFSLLALRERIAVSAEDLDSARALLSAIAARQAAGSASALELANQRAAVAAGENALADLQGQEAGLLARLAVLCGHDPEGFTVAATRLEDLQEPALAAGLPSSLLQRRPDILSAEATLVSARADLAAARAAFFPVISLTASGGVQDPAVQAAVTTLAGTGPSLTLGASLLQSLFDGGQRRAAREAAAGREQEIVAAYRASIRNALVDVESALGERHFLLQQQDSRAQAVAQGQVALEVARARYEAGAGDYLSLLDAQRSLHALRDADIQYRDARLQSVVALFRALGGGWQQP